MSLDPGQLDFPFALDTPALLAFLDRWHVLEDEQERLREEVRLLKQRHQDDFPMRGVLTAVKIVRARRKLAAHPREPMAPEHLASLEALVEAHLEAVAQATAGLAQGLAETAPGATPRRARGGA